jgi:hypothetical protein
MVARSDGGPEGAWNDGFSFRWNPQLWAARGYAVIAINPTGSTGFGQAFTDAVRGDWGGAPYRDIMNGVEYILAQNPWIDGERSCACGTKPDNLHSLNRGPAHSFGPLQVAHMVDIWSTGSTLNPTSSSVS